MAKTEQPKDEIAPGIELSEAAAEAFEPYDTVVLNDREIDRLWDRLEANDPEDVAHIFAEELSAADTADFLQKIDPEDRIRYLEAYREHIQPETFLHLDEGLRKEMLEFLPNRSIARIIADLDSDDALDLILPLDPEDQDAIIKLVSAKTRAAIREGLSYPEDSAGRLMQREFVAVPKNWTVGKTIDYLRAAADDLPTDFFDIIVITPDYHVAGEIPLNRLIRSQRKEKLENLTLDDVHTIPATMDQEEVARLFQRENLGSAPVIDEDERLIGVVTVDDILEVIHEEAEEDFLKLGGVDTGDLYRAVLSTTRSRFSWLLVNLFTAILASFVISFFDATIQQIVALAVLMPIVASMGGNAGTQALTVAVRALATKELSSTNAMRVIWKETLVGAINGSAFAIIAGIVAGLWFQDIGIGIVIALAMIVNLVAAGLFGASIPVLIEKAGGDPALASTVLLTTVTDVVGFFAFLGLAALFLM
ncbi:MAG: magnesium transporter [Pseudobdellovibrionaceae bacterium]